MKSDLIRFQTYLLEALDQDATKTDIVRCLAADPALRVYCDYFGKAEPRMVRVAAELVKKWGRKTQTPS